MFRWLGLALIGILVAAAVSVAASRLVSQQIGLASQPVSAGDALAPKAETKARRAGTQPRRSHAGQPARAKRKTMPGKGEAGTTSSPPGQATTRPGQAPPSHSASGVSPTQSQEGGGAASPPRQAQEAPGPVVTSQPEAQPAPAPSQPAEPTGGGEGEPSAGPDD